VQLDPAAKVRPEQVSRSIRKSPALAPATDSVPKVAELPVTLTVTV
jgi:hypothetical protein